MKYLKAILPVMLFAIAACKQQNNGTAYLTAFNDPILYCKTVKALNDVVLENNFPPVIASRNYVYANIAAYECMVTGDSSYNSLHTQISHLPAMPKPLPAARKISHTIRPRLLGTYNSQPNSPT